MLDPRIEFSDFTMPYSWQKEACHALTRIINETDAKIVISSDWRFHYSIAQFNEMFKYFNIPEVVIGKTGTGKAKMSSSRAMDRGFQIVNWVRSDTGITSWVCLDDLNVWNYFDYIHSECPEILPEHHINVDGNQLVPSDTLTGKADLIIKMLNANDTQNAPHN